VRVPIGWLAEHVDVPVGTTVEELDAAFVRLGLEVEEVHRPAEVTGPLVVGRVLEIEELTVPDRLQEADPVLPGGRR
jgi:phenylalanyl-tRNA synthetase beta chain